jgi:hypothetical protein
MNFRKWLIENTDTRIKELYHATLSGPNNEIFNSFTHDGIDPERSKGNYQGSGFYLYQDKQQALNHARDLNDIQDRDNLIFRKEGKVKGTPIIIVVDEPITPECFDIDYETFAHSFPSSCMTTTIFSREMQKPCI